MKELTLREVQLSSLTILKKVDEICKHLELDYFIMYGTLIGSVRHNGFIPWDDDVDIMMPREDYNKLTEYFLNNDIENFTLFNYRASKDYPYMISRVSDDRYQINVENEAPYGIGTFIDIYPLDYISKNKFLANIIGCYHGFCSSLYFSATRICPPKFASSPARYLSFYLAKLIGKEKIKRVLIKNRNYSVKGNDCYIGCLQWMTMNYKRNIFHSSSLDGRVDLQFEDIYVKAPQNYNEILTYYYGDYMELPPENMRVPHHLYKAYRK